MLLFFFGIPAIAVFGVLERLARKRWGVVFGVPIGTLVEDYPVDVGKPREVDLSPHPEPVTLQAEIVLKPRAVPVQQPAAAPLPARKPLPPRTKARCSTTPPSRAAAPASVRKPCR